MDLSQLLIEAFLHFLGLLGPSFSFLLLLLNHPLLGLRRLLSHVEHPLLRLLVQLLLTFLSAQLIGLERFNQRHHGALHLVLVVNHALQQLNLRFHRILHRIIAAFHRVSNELLVVNRFDSTFLAGFG